MAFRYEQDISCPDQFSVYPSTDNGHVAGNPPNTPAAELLFNAAGRDAHGVGVTKHEKYV
jgi:hypothetical protein